MVVEVSVNGESRLDALWDGLLPCSSHQELSGAVRADVSAELICAADQRCGTGVRTFSSQLPRGAGSGDRDALGVPSGHLVRPDRKADRGMHPGGFALARRLSRRRRRIRYSVLAGRWAV